MDRQGVMGVPASRVEEVTRALEAMDDMIWSEGVAERVARVALAADAVEGDRPRSCTCVPYVDGGVTYHAERCALVGGGVEPSREFRPPTPLERALADSAAHWQARVVELEAALRQVDESIVAGRYPSARVFIKAALAAAGEGDDRHPAYDVHGQVTRLASVLRDELNDVGPLGTGYRRALDDIVEQIRLRFGGSGSRLPEPEDQ